MAENDNPESETTWKPFAERTAEDLDEMRRELEQRMQTVREREERGEFDDKPHTVSFELKYAQGLGVNCSTRAFPDKEKAEEAKSKLEQVEQVFGTQVERV